MQKTPEITLPAAREAVPLLTRLDTRPYVDALLRLGYAEDTSKAGRVVSNCLEFIQGLPSTKREKEQPIQGSAKTIRILTEGYATLSCVTRSGREQIIEIAAPVSFLGLPDKLTTKTLTACEVKYCPTATFITNPDLNAFFRMSQAIRIEHMTDRLIELANKKDTYQRTAGAILAFFTTGCLPKITQAILAEYAGISRESVNKAIPRLVELGLVSTSARGRNLKITDQSGLAQIYGE